MLLAYKSTSLTVKYAVPLMDPLFFPLGSSRITPTHLPTENVVIPMYAILPRTPFPATSTLWPIFIFFSDILAIWVCAKITKSAKDTKWKIRYKKLVRRTGSQKGVRTVQFDWNACGLLTLNNTIYDNLNTHFQLISFRPFKGSRICMWRIVICAGNPFKICEIRK